MSDDWSKLTVTERYARGEQTVAIASLSALFYLDQPIDRVAASAHKSIEKYLALVGIEALGWYVSGSGEWKPLKPRVLKKDRGILADFPTDYEAFEIYYDSEPVPGPFGLALNGSKLSARPMAATATDLLRFDFPVAWSRDDEALARVRAFVIDVLSELPAQTANAGLCFKRPQQAMNEAKRGVHKLLPRYLGFDPYYSLVQYNMLGATFSAHWLNFVNSELRKALGDESLLASCETLEISGGLLIQGAKLPPVGDSNRQAPDLGCLPDVARFLKPLRSALTALGTPDFDAQVWLARFDEMSSRPWDNSDAV